MIRTIYKKAYALYIDARQEEYQSNKYKYDYNFEELLDFIKKLIVENPEN